MPQPVPLPLLLLLLRLTTTIKFLLPYYEDIYSITYVVLLACNIWIKAPDSVREEDSDIYERQQC